MKNHEIIAKIKDYKHKSSSFSGNPQYEVTLECLDGSTFDAITARDALCAYDVKGHKGTTFVVKYHLTAKGTKVIDFLSPLKGDQFAYNTGRGVKYDSSLERAFAYCVMAIGPFKGPYCIFDTHSGEVLKKDFPSR